jgi:hypothetical protein
VEQYLTASVIPRENNKLSGVKFLYRTNPNPSADGTKFNAKLILN